MITCGTCKFQTNNITFVLERTLPAGDVVADCGTGCTDLNLSSANFLGIKNRTFDGMKVRTITIHGVPFQNLPKNLFGMFNGTNKTAVSIKGSGLSCLPTHASNKVAITVDAGDTAAHSGGTCKYIHTCGGCDFFINNEGLASMGGECSKSCLELNLSKKGVKKLPKSPNGLVDPIKILQVLYLGNEVDLIVTRHFSLNNLWGRRLYVLREDGNSWQYLAKAWFKIKQNHDLTLTSLVQ